MVEALTYGYGMMHGLILSRSDGEIFSTLRPDGNTREGFLGPCMVATKVPISADQTGFGT